METGTTTLKLYASANQSSCSLRAVIPGGCSCDTIQWRDRAEVTLTWTFNFTFELKCAFVANIKKSPENDLEMSCSATHYASSYGKNKDTILTNCRITVDTLKSCVCVRQQSWTGLTANDAYNHCLSFH